MREINKIVVHCSATPPGMDIGREEIAEWHVARGFSDIGYHWVIRRNGDVEAGRPPSVIGAHAAGQNSRSLGICLVGGTSELTGAPESNYTREQYHALQGLLTGLSLVFDAEIVGHRDLPEVNKACPCFSVRSWWYGP